jgi:DNA (cytosine-5)-methyltransferase 1
MLPTVPHVPADRIIDNDSAPWSLVDRPGRSARTLERVANGRAAHGSRFLIAYYGNESGGRSLSRPIGTITTRDRYAIVDGDRMRMLSAQEYRAGMGFPADYKLPDNHRLAVHMLGNAVCPPVARDIIQYIKSAA